MELWIGKKFEFYNRKNNTPKAKFLIFPPPKEPSRNNLKFIIYHILICIFLGKSCGATNPKVFS